MRVNYEFTFDWWHTPLGARGPSLETRKLDIFSQNQPKFGQISEKMNFKPIFPSKEFCGDNAAMIAWAGIQRYNKKLFDNKNDLPLSRWPLDTKAPFLKGSGLKL